MGELNTFNQLIPVTKRDSEAGKTRKTWTEGMFT
jgi:hypothetical protein